MKYILDMIAALFIIAAYYRVKHAIERWWLRRKLLRLIELMEDLQRQFEEHIRRN